MVSSCSAIGCKERAVKGSRLTFHRFPENPELRNKWVKALKRKNFEPTKNSRVCEKHFTAKAYNHFSTRKKLIDNAVPELFDFSGFVKDGQPIRKLDDSERIHSIKFVDVNDLLNNDLLSTQNRTVVVIDNVVKKPRVETSHFVVTVPGTSVQNGHITSLPVIKSSFSLNTIDPIKSTVPVQSVENLLPQSNVSRSNSFSEVTKRLESVAPRTPDLLTYDCTEKRLINKALQIKKKFNSRLKVMNLVSRHLKKRKTFLENLLIKIKEKQLTSYEDVTDLMDCFVEEEDEEETPSSDEDSSSNAEEYKKIIAFIHDKISKFEKIVQIRSGLSNSSEYEAYGLHLESILNAMPKENATNVQNQITKVLKGYQRNRLQKTYQDLSKTFSGLENIEMTDIE